MKEPLDVQGLLDGTRFVFLGGTGFLGKVMLAMLLDRYPSIGKIFLLVRSSKKQTTEERFWKDIATSRCFEPLREKYPGPQFEEFLKSKIVPIDGDVGRPNCGIEPGLLKDLKGTLDAVVNVAGVVDFNPPLDEALDANAFGTKNVVDLAKTLGDTPLFHTSTCYVAGRRKGPIFEVPPGEYPYPRCDELGRDAWDPEREVAECLELVAQAKHRSEDAFRKSEFREKALKNLRDRGEPSEGPAYESEYAKVKRKYVSDMLVEVGKDRATHWGWPNIYTYTKSIGEQLVAKSGLRFTIARPACCETTVAFPFEGWNEGVSTSAPILYMAMKGQVNIPAAEVSLDLIPSDYVAAGMIMALAELLEGTPKAVYQFGAADVNPCTVARFAELIGLYKRRYYQKKGGNPFLNFYQAHVEPQSVTLETFDRIGPPAIAKASKNLAKALRSAAVGPTAEMFSSAAKSLDAVAYRETKIGEIFHLFAPFTVLENGPFDCSNTRAAYARLSDEDKSKLPWAPESLDWADWMRDVQMPTLEKLIMPEMDRRLKKETQPLRAHETLVTMMRQMAGRHEMSTCLQRVETDGLSRITYREFEKRADAVAARLAQAGVQKGHRVVLAGHNHPDWVIAYFGILVAGGTVVPVDPNFEPEVLATIVRESEAFAAVWDADVEKKSGGHVRATHRKLTVLGLRSLTDEAPLSPPLVEVDDDDVASLIYTSGTTGTPKGVMLTHKNFTALVASLAPLFPLKPGQAVLSVLPLHHTFEFTCGMLLPLTRGARVVYLDELTGDRLSHALKKASPTAMVGVPALWQMLERRITTDIKGKGPAFEMAVSLGTEANRFLGKTLGVDVGRLLFGPVHAALGGKVKYLISGGASLPAETFDTFAGLGLHLTEGYGLTEAAPVLTVSNPSPKSKAGQVGKAIPGVTVKIQDPDDRGVGEIVAKGPNVMAGYTGSDATEGVVDADGWLHTGDLGKFDKAGRLQIVGRSKDVIVTTTGENVYPDDVERRVGAVEHIEEFAIVGITTRGGSEKVACLGVPKKDDGVDRAERMERAMKSLRSALAKLPYGEQPAVVQLQDSALPRTSTRKVKRGEVKATIERNLVGSTRPLEAAPGTTNVRVAISVLKNLPLGEVRPEMTLKADLGFDSLLLTELHEILESKGGAVDHDQLAACRTVAEVEALVHAPRSKAPSRTKSIEGSAPVAFDVPPAVQDFGKKMIGRLQDVFYGTGMKSRVFGSAHIPHNRNTIVVSNHASHLDMGFVRHALGTYGEEIVSLAAQDYFFEGGVRKTFFENFSNLQAIDRNAGLRGTLRQAGEVIGSGKTVLIFPEGTRSPNGEVTEFKPLIGQLALANGVDILPIYLGGTHGAMPKGSILPTKREIVARIGLPLAVADLRRLTQGMSNSDAAREVARIARQAVLALRDGGLLDLSKVGVGSSELDEKANPLVRVFDELGKKFRADKVDKPVSFYFTLGGDADAKWTVKVDKSGCQITPGKPEGFQADCVLKTSPEIFTKIVREAYVPSPAEFLSGAIKSNDPSLLYTFQEVFALS
ncbi:MAG: AMP-binding protein [Polyangiaceae bacterium]